MKSTNMVEIYLNSNLYTPYRWFSEDSKDVINMFPNTFLTMTKTCPGVEILCRKHYMVTFDCGWSRGMILFTSNILRSTKLDIAA